MSAIKAFALSIVLIPQLLLAQGSVEGDVYLVTRSGDVRQGAANQVYLIQDSNTLADGWSSLCLEQKAQSDEITTENDRKTAEFDSRIRNAPNSARQSQLRAESIDHLQKSIDDIVAIVKIQSQARAEWIVSKAINIASTGMRAHYNFDGIEVGSYWLFARMELGNNSNYWIVPVRIIDGSSQTIDLDNNNLFSPFNCDSQPFSTN